MDKPLVSIVVAIYNGEKYLKECVDSILNQTYDNLEIILVDDGSPDSCPKICDDYAKNDKRVKVIHQKNGGVSAARNAAIEQMSGEYVCIMDQDDRLSPDYVEYLYGLIEKYNADISVVPNVVYATNSRNIYDEKNNESKTEVISNQEAACLMLYAKMEIGPWSKMVSKETIDKARVRFPKGIYGGDGYVFSVRSFMAADKVAVGYKGIYYYRVDNYESEMSKFRPRTLKSSIEATNIMYKEFSGASKKMKRATKYAQWRVYVSFLNNLLASGTVKDYRDIYKMLVKNSRKYAYRSFCAEVSMKRKIKDAFYLLSPTLVTIYNVKKNKKRDFNK